MNRSDEVPRERDGQAECRQFTIDERDRIADERERIADERERAHRVWDRAADQQRQHACT